jgi:hypothetical protein
MPAIRSVRRPVARPGSSAWDIPSNVQEKEEEERGVFPRFLPTLSGCEISSR